MKRVRITIRHNPEDTADDLRYAARVRRDLWAHSPVEIDPDSSEHATQRDATHNAFFEFATNYRDEINRVLKEFGHEQRVTVEEIGDQSGSECVNCGHVAPELNTVCPKCGFRDIDPCPHCNQEIARLAYLPVSGAVFQCPLCHHKVRLSFQHPLMDADGHYNQPLVRVDPAEAPVHGV